MLHSRSQQHQQGRRDKLITNLIPQSVRRDRLAIKRSELDQDKLYTSVGAGMGYETVVGAVQVAVGYKLNPSPLDIRSPAGVLAALNEGRPLSTVPTENGRRWHLHFSIGSSF